MKLRIQKIDPGQLALLVMLLFVPAFVIYAGYMVVTGGLREGPEPLIYGLASILGTGVGAFIVGVLFNLLAPLVGGLTIEVLEGDAAPATPAKTEVDLAAPADEVSGTKRCPSCKTEMNAGRSFCPECDHDFT